MRLLPVALLFALTLTAHVGSPDIFFQGDAGPYRLLVTIRPPSVVPGVAEIEIRSTGAGVQAIHIVPLRLGFKGSQFPPVPDLAQPSKEDPQFYTGALWLMVTGSWQVKIDVDGDRGPGSLSVPVPALSTRVLPMQHAVAAILLGLGLVLAIGMVSIFGAGVREAFLAPGVVPDARRARRARVVMAVAALAVAGIVWGGSRWWGAEEGDYMSILYKPLSLQPVLADGRLVLKLHDPGWLNRREDDLLPDHGHLMHLYVIGIPSMDHMWHLHPELDSGGDFTQHLPDMPAGRYALYGDIVHANGLAETATAEIDLPQIAGAPLTGDDAAGIAPALGSATGDAVLAGGAQMAWIDKPDIIHARRPYEFHFRVNDAAGNPAAGMELYMGMLGHAAFVSADRTVFAHIHPTGSVPMAVLQLTQPGDAHAGHHMQEAVLPADVSFPYGFPKSGEYRIFVQVKQHGDILTGVFDVNVEK